MREHRKLSHILQRSHYFISIVVVFLFLCVKFDNPVDPKFKGSYDFDISNLKDKDSIYLSIFQPYSIEIDTSVSKDTYYDFSCTVEKDSVAVDSQLTIKNHFYLIFYKPCTTTVYVNAIRPNDIKDSKELTFIVQNNFHILGNNLLPKNDTASFTIKSDSLNVIPAIKWSIGIINSIIPIDSSFSVFYSDVLTDSVYLNAELLYNSSISYRFSKLIRFKGATPRIEKVTIKNADASKLNLNQVDSFNVFLKCSDPDSNPYRIVIKDSIRTLQSKEYKIFTPTCTLLVPPVKKPYINSLKIIITDSMGYNNTFDTIVKVDTVVPSVKCFDTIMVAVNDTFNFKIESSVNSMAYKWRIIQEGISIDSGSSDTPIWKIKPLKIGNYLVKVIPVNTNNNSFVQDSTILVVKEYAYKTVLNNFLDTTIKVNRPCTLHVSLEKNSSDTVKYIWSYPENVKASITELDSLLVLNFNNIVDTFVISAQGIVGSDSAQPAEINVNVQKLAPVFSFIDTSYSTKVNQPFKVKITTSLTDPEKSPIKSYLYKVLEYKDTLTRSYDSIQGINIGAVDTFNIVMWCIDNDNARSNLDTATVTVSADLPYITFSNDDIKFPINSRVTISGITVHTGNSGSPVDSIFWKKDDSNSVFEAVKVSENIQIVIDSTGYGKPATISLIFKCKDQKGVVSLPITKTIQIFSDIPKIESFSISESSKIYKGIPVKFNIAITDPDDDSLVLNILGNNLPLKSVKVAKSDTLSLNFKDSGSYILKMTAKDDTGHISDEFTLSSIVKVDQGIPVVNNIRIPNGLVYIKDAVKCTVSAVDYNGKINKFQYYLNDSLYKDTADSVLRFTFADSGTKKISVKVFDSDTLPSEIKSVSFIVRRGQPVVDSFSVDSNSVYVNGKRTFRILASDSNGIIMRKEIQWNDKIDSIVSYNQNESIINESIIDTFEVKDTSLSVVKLRVMDEDSIYSEWKVCSLIVKKGVPKIDSIQITPAGPIFVKDNITLHVFASDLNDSIKTVDVSWSNNGSFVNMVKTDGKYQVQKLLYKGDSSFNKILIRVTDKSGFIKDSLFPISVLPGYPVISDIYPDTVWALRDTAITVVASDPDSGDYITRRSFDWDNNSFFDISTTSDFIVHKWDTLPGIDYPSQFQVMVEDNDSLTTTKLFSVFVKLGRPVLSGASFGDSIQWVKGSGAASDTMFYKWNSGDTYVRINATDPNPNGQIVRYDWNRRDDGTIDYPNDLATLYKYFVPDTSEMLSVRVRDNDGLWSDKLVFYVFPDGPPPAITTTSDAGQGVRIIKWSGKDAKDRNNTLYKIVVKKGTASAADSVTTADESDSKNIISDFKTGAQYEADNAYDFKFNYSLGQNGIYHYRIIAKDARGSVSKTAGDPQFSF